MYARASRRVPLPFHREHPSQRRSHRVVGPADRRHQVALREIIGLVPGRWLGPKPIYPNERQVGGGVSPDDDARELEDASDDHDPIGPSHKAGDGDDQARFDDRRGRRRWAGPEGFVGVTG